MDIKCRHHSNRAITMGKETIVCFQCFKCYILIVFYFVKRIRNPCQLSQNPHDMPRHFPRIHQQTELTFDHDEITERNSVNKCNENRVAFTINFERNTGNAYLPTIFSRPGTEQISNSKDSLLPLPSSPLHLNKKLQKIERQSHYIEMILTRQFY